MSEAERQGCCEGEDSAPTRWFAIAGVVGGALLALSLLVYFVIRPAPVLHKLTYSVVVQKTSGSRSVGTPAVESKERVFVKRDLVALEIDTPEAGHLYAFQCFEDGSFELLFPLEAGKAATSAGKRTRLPQEAEKWLGFLTSNVTLVWSPRPLENLEAAIEQSEEEEDHIRAIRQPQAAAKLEAMLKSYTESTTRTSIENGRLRSELASTADWIGFRIRIQVE